MLQYSAMGFPRKKPWEHGFNGLYTIMGFNGGLTNGICNYNLNYNQEWYNIYMYIYIYIYIYFYLFIYLHLHLYLHFYLLIYLFLWSYYIITTYNIYIYIYILIIQGYISSDMFAIPGPMLLDISARPLFGGSWNDSFSGLLPNESNGR